MKRATAIRHVAEVGEQATERREVLGRLSIRWPLLEVWVGGEVLDDVAELDHGAVVLVLDLPRDELPWLALHPDGEFVGAELRLGKRSLLWSYRPAEPLVWTPHHRRLVRFWTADAGLDHDVIDRLRARDVARLDLTELTHAEVELQARGELVVSQRHLAEVLDRYWDRGWRAEHRGIAGSPEDTLWRAAQGARELHDIIDGRTT